VTAALPPARQWITSLGEEASPVNLEPRLPAAGMGFPVVLVNGRRQGVWHPELNGSKVEVVIERFVRTPLWV
jgi:hypothetical protein